MKKNTFKYTFYFGLLIILGLTVLLTAVSFNIYKSISNKVTIKKEEERVVEVPLLLDKEIIHDTIYFEKPIVKQVDTPKQKKGINPIIQTTVDTPFINDSIVK